jgi:NAD(P)-dependent dehydrogenase (short-subunit alcohol dehydrogenase family)
VEVPDEHLPGNCKYARQSPRSAQFNPDTEVFEVGRLDGKVAVITGAASGIGGGTALCLAKEGAAVVAADLNSQGGERVIGEIAAAGGRAVFQHTDVTSEADIKAAVARAVKDYGRLDIMFNNAGLVGAIGPIEAVSAEDWNKTVAVLLRSVFLGIKYAVEPMRKVGGGSIISTSSVASFLPSPYGAAYAASKGAVISLTRAAALQLGRDRIRVNCICPGVINTAIWGVVPGMDDPAVLEQALGHAQTIPRVGRPEDIASMVLFLASDESQWITGQAMIVDGGVTVGPNFPVLTLTDQQPIPTVRYTPLTRAACSPRWAEKSLVARYAAIASVLRANQNAGEDPIIG